MKTNILTVLSILFFISGCTKEVNTIVGNDDKTGNQNIIFASSFERDSVASWDGWVNPGPPVVKLANDAPVSGGKYSIFLKAKDVGAIVYKTIPANTGTYKYALTFWAKATEDPGTLEIYLKRGTQKINSKRGVISSKDWVEYKIETEFTATGSDSLEIYMSGSNYVVPQGFTYFDSIVLRLID
jgi:hypothetical protein